MDHQMIHHVLIGFHSVGEEDYQPSRIQLKHKNWSNEHPMILNNTIKRNGKKGKKSNLTFILQYKSYMNRMRKKVKTKIDIWTDKSNNYDHNARNHKRVDLKSEKYKSFFRTKRKIFQVID